MKVWCSVEGDGTEVIWTRKPKKDDDEQWQPWRNVYPGEVIFTEDQDYLSALFPKGVKKGQCVKCTLNRLEVDDG